MLRINNFFISVLLISLLLPGCSGDKASKFKNSSTMHKLTEIDWIRLSEKRIFFGHRSVGRNIIEGIVELRNESNSSAFTVLETKDKSDFNNPVFAHSPIGKNGDPISKIDDFVNILKSGLADSVDIAFMKLCYVDIKKHTDIEEIFKYYQSTIGSLQVEYPNLKIIHFTVPITTKPKGIKGLARIILKMDDNKYRNKFNTLMRNSYSDIELFDLAKFESTFPNNKSNIYWFKTPGLIPEYSSDGRHLNQQGRLLIARELMYKLLAIN